jgi:hypothetical protein
VLLHADATLQQQIVAAWPAGGGACEIRIDGALVDPLTDPRLDVPPTHGVRVALVTRPAGAMVRPFRGILRVFDPVLNRAFTSLGLYGSNSPADGAFTGKDSPNNSLTVQTNIVRAYQGVPDVYGYRRIWPDLIQPSVVEYVSNVKQVTEWMCLSRGKGEITAIQYAETPLSDITGASYTVFEPVPVGGVYEFGATTITDVYEQFASPDVSGQELPYAITFPTLAKVGTFAANNGDAFFTVAITDGADLDNLKSLVPSGTAHVNFTYSAGTFDADCTVQAVVVASGTATFTFSSAVWGGGPFSEGGISFTIAPHGSTSTVVGPITLPIAASQIWWNLAFLRGLQGTVQVKSEWWKIDSAGVEIGGTRQNQTDGYTAASYDQKFFTQKVTPSGGAGRYKIQFTRLTVQISGDGADVAKLELVSSVRYSASKIMPACTIMRLSTKASEGSAGLGERKFNVRWHRWCRTLSGVTPGATRNFARAIAHIWHINGNDISQIDTSAFAAVNAEFGEDSPMLRYDGSLDDSDVSLGGRMQTIADTARCMIWRDGTQWSVVRDQARTEIDLQLDYRTLAAGGESSMSFSAHMPRSQDGVEVEYVDEATQQTRAYVRLSTLTGAPVVGSPLHPIKVKLTGCTTTAQATNRAYLEARRLLYQRVTVTDTALAEAQALAPLALVRWVDPTDFGGAEDALQAGEVLAVDGLNVTTSEPLAFAGEPDGRIQFTGTDGRMLGSPILCTPAAGGRCVLDTAAPAGVYVAGTTRQLGSRYAFGPGLSAAELAAAGLYTVVPPLRPTGRDGNVTLTLVNYDSRIYEMD